MARATCILLTLVLGMSAAASAQQTGVGRDQVDDNTWFGRVTPYFWLSGLGGDRALGAPETPNVADNYVVAVGNEELYPAFAGSIAIGKGRWALSSYFQSASLTDTTEITRYDTDFFLVDGAYSFSWTEWDAKLNYRVGEFRAPYVQMFAGIRSITWKQDVTTLEDYEAFEISVEEGELLGDWENSWIDPLIGASVAIGMGSGFTATGYTDVAGFGVGSKLSWTIAGGIDYHIYGPIHFTGMYRYKQVSFENDKPLPDRFFWQDGVAEGWYLGLSFAYPGGPL